MGRRPVQKDFQAFVGISPQGEQSFPAELFSGRDGRLVSTYHDFGAMNRSRISADKAKQYVTLVVLDRVVLPDTFWKNISDKEYQAALGNNHDYFSLPYNGRERELRSTFQGLGLANLWSKQRSVVVMTPEAERLVDNRLGLSDYAGFLQENGYRVVPFSEDSAVMRQRIEDAPSIRRIRRGW